MTGFPLLSIAPALLEKTIKKNRKVIFAFGRLAGTRMISFETVRIFLFRWMHTVSLIKKYNLFVLNGVNYHAPTESSDVYFEALHGIRIDSLSLLAPEETERYNQLCNLLKTHQITCRKIIIRDGKWTAEQCAALLNVLKPEKICLYCARAGLSESVLQQKTLKYVDVCLKSNAAAIAGAKLLAAGFEDLTVHVTRTSTPFYLVHSILKILCSTPFPKMRKFTIFVDGHRDMPPNDEIEEKLRDGLRGQLRDFQAYTAASAFEEEDVVTAVIDIPFWSPDECTCKLTIRDMLPSLIEYRRKVQYLVNLPKNFLKFHRYCKLDKAPTENDGTYQPGVGRVVHFHRPPTEMAGLPLLTLLPAHLEKTTITKDKLREGLDGYDFQMERDSRPVYGGVDTFVFTMPSSFLEGSAFSVDIDEDGKVEIEFREGPEDSISWATVHLIPRCQELTILTELPYSDQSSFFQTILQILLNNYSPNLRKFDFRILYEKLWPSEDEFEKLFGDLGLSIEEDEEEAHFAHAHFPRESSCTVVVQEYRDGLHLL